MVPVAPIITGITFVFTFHTRCISVIRASYILESSRLLSLLLLLLVVVVVAVVVVVLKRDGNSVTNNHASDWKPLNLTSANSKQTTPPPPSSPEKMLCGITGANSTQREVGTKVQHGRPGN
jgi:hypothetical protein